MLGKDGGPEVPAFTVDQICSNYQLLRVDLLKMDIEGARRKYWRMGALCDVSFVIVER